jgi:hypothetical protein
MDWNWREEILLRKAKPTVFADLGYGVLDTAMVETAAYCCGRRTRPRLRPSWSRIATILE